MKNISRKVKQLENQLGIDKETSVIVIKRWEDFIAAGYFRDKSEEDAFIAWRIERLKEEHKHTTLPYILYAPSKKDIELRLTDFRVASPRV